MNTETAVEKNAEVKQAYPRGRWTVANPFKTSRPPAVPGVQAELSLEQVKPIRNDLSDTDLELQPRSREENVFAAPSEAGPEVKKLPWWKRLKMVVARGGKRVEKRSSIFRAPLQG